VITIDDILSAQERVAPFIRRTPVLSAMQMRDCGGLEGRVTLKLELLQVAGSFNARGAMNRLKTLPPERLKHGLATASGGVGERTRRSSKRRSARLMIVSSSPTTRCRLRPVGSGSNSGLQAIYRERHRLQP
jgi:hypothetical protein